MEKRRPNQILRSRTYAFTIDLFLILTIEKIFTLGYFNFINTYFNLLPHEILNRINTNFAGMNVLCSVIIFWSYFLSSYYLGKGQTIGKMLFNINVKSKKFPHNPPNILEIFLRTCGYFFCYITGSLLFILPFVTKNKKGLPDWLSSTESCYKNVPAIVKEFYIIDDNIPTLPLVFNNMPDRKKSA